MSLEDEKREIGRVGMFDVVSFCLSCGALDDHSLSEHYLQKLSLSGTLKASLRFSGNARLSSEFDFKDWAEFEKCIPFCLISSEFSSSGEGESEGYCLNITPYHSRGGR